MVAKYGCIMVTVWLAVAIYECNVCAMNMVAVCCLVQPYDTVLPFCNHIATVAVWLHDARERMGAVWLTKLHSTTIVQCG